MATFVEGIGHVATQVTDPEDRQVFQEAVVAFLATLQPVEGEGRGTLLRVLGPGSEFEEIGVPERSG